MSDDQFIQDNINELRDTLKDDGVSYILKLLNDVDLPDDFYNYFDYLSFVEKESCKKLLKFNNLSKLSDDDIKAIQDQGKLRVLIEEVGEIANTSSINVLVKLLIILKQTSDFKKTVLTFTVLQAAEGISDLRKELYETGTTKFAKMINIISNYIDLDRSSLIKILSKMISNNHSDYITEISPLLLVRILDTLKSSGLEEAEKELSKFTYSEEANHNILQTEFEINPKIKQKDLPSFITRTTNYNNIFGDRDKIVPIVKKKLYQFYKQFPLFDAEDSLYWIEDRILHQFKDLTNKLAREGKEYNYDEFDSWLDEKLKEEVKEQSLELFKKLADSFVIKPVMNKQISKALFQANEIDREIIPSFIENQYVLYLLILYLPNINAQGIIKVANAFKGNKLEFPQNIRSVGYLKKLPQVYAIRSIDEFIAKINKLEYVTDFFHNEIQNGQYMQESDFDLLVQLLNLKVDFKSKTVKDAVIIYDAVVHDALNGSSAHGMTRADEAKYNIDVKKILDNMKVISSKLANSTLSGSDFALVKETIAGYDFLNNYETIQEYKDKIETKLPQVTDINYTLENGLNFHVLPNGSSKHLTIGKDTDCCQRLGGAGEDAAIDSFINSDAGVLLLSGPSGLIAQSYFHYVPKDNGYILDNIEINERNAKGINLESIYYSLAKKLKEDKKAAYVKCGEGYNKISNDYFNKAKLEEDPRKFSVEEPYSDFDEEEHLNLDSPTIELPVISMTKSASINIFKKTALDLLILDHQITKLAKITDKVILSSFNKIAINFSNVLSDKVISKINNELSHCKGLDNVSDVLSKFELKILKGKNYLVYQGTNKRPLGFMDMHGISVRNAELTISDKQDGVSAKITKTPLREWGLLEEKVLGPFTEEVD